MAPPSATAAEIVSLLDNALSTIPGLRVIIRDHCHGFDWMIAASAREIHINGQLSNHDAADATAEAITALRLYLANGHATPLLRLVPGQHDELADRRWRHDYLQTS